MKSIPLTKGKAATVDDHDAAKVADFSWYFHSEGYAARRETIDGKSRIIYMHRQLLNAPADMVVDHVNGNRLDNRRSNIRLATHSQNNVNADRPAHNTSGYKGVSWSKVAGRWEAYVTVNRKKKYLGLFLTAEAAAKEYNRVMSDIFGDRVKLNVIREK